jgi:hypothetical protein
MNDRKSANGIHPYDVSILRSLIRRDSLTIEDDVREMSSRMRPIGRRLRRSDAELRVAMLEESLCRAYGRDLGYQILEHILDPLDVLL